MQKSLTFLGQIWWRDSLKKQKYVVILFWYGISTNFSQNWRHIASVTDLQAVRIRKQFLAFSFSFEHARLGFWKRESQVMSLKLCTRKRGTTLLLTKNTLNLHKMWSVAICDHQINTSFYLFKHIWATSWVGVRKVQKTWQFMFVSKIYFLVEFSSLGEWGWSNSVFVILHGNAGGAHAASKCGGIMYGTHDLWIKWSSGIPFILSVVTSREIKLPNMPIDLHHKISRCLQSVFSSGPFCTICFEEWEQSISSKCFFLSNLHAIAQWNIFRADTRTLIFFIFFSLQDWYVL